HHLEALPPDAGEEDLALVHDPTACRASRDRWICPVAGVRGSASTTRTCRGCLKGARRLPMCPRSASTVGGGAPSAITTAAQTTSPHRGSGTPTTATSARPG